MRVDTTRVARTTIIPIAKSGRLDSGDQEFWLAQVWPTHSYDLQGLGATTARGQSHRPQKYGDWRLARMLFAAHPGLGIQITGILFK